jgi:hypothetical protein
MAGRSSSASRSYVRQNLALHFVAFVTSFTEFHVSFATVMRNQSIDNQKNKQLGVNLIRARSLLILSQTLSEE